MEYNTSTIESEMQNLLAARNNLRNLLSEEAPYTFDNEKIHLHNKIEELQIQIKNQEIEWEREKSQIRKGYESSEDQEELVKAIKRNNTLEEERVALKQELETHGLLVQKLEKALEEILTSKQDISENVVSLQAKLIESTNELAYVKQSYDNLSVSKDSKSDIEEKHVAIENLKIQIQKRDHLNNGLVRKMQEMVSPENESQTEQHVSRIEKLIQNAMQAPRTEPLISEFQRELAATMKRMESLEQSIHGISGQHIHSPSLTTGRNDSMNLSWSLKKSNSKRKILVSRNATDKRTKSTKKRRAR